MDRFYEAAIFTTNKDLYRMVFSERQDVTELFSEAFISVEPFDKFTDYFLIPTSDIKWIKIRKLPAGAI